MNWTLPFPVLVTGDWHIHSRGNKQRLTELDYLIQWILEAQSGKHFMRRSDFKSLVICGDLLDRGAPLRIDIVLKLAALFSKFEEVHIVVGNHDNPVRSSKVTQLDIFQLCPNVNLIKEFFPLCSPNGNFVFMPYYAPVNSAVECHAVFAHKDVKERNPYYDAEWAISWDEFPKATYVFNGHLHSCDVQVMKNAASYIQLGAPYPTSWSDNYQKNQFLWEIVDDSENGMSTYASDPTCITGDDSPQNKKLFKIVRSRSEKDEDEDDQSEVLNALEDIRESGMSVSQALSAAGVDGGVCRIVNSIVERVSGTVMGEKL